VTAREWFRSMRAQDFAECPETLIAVRAFVDIVTCPCDYCQPGVVVLQFPTYPHEPVRFWRKADFVRWGERQQTLEEIKLKMKGFCYYV
jgi:hypothetical protein